MTTSPDDTKAVSKLIAWRNAMSMTLMGCLLGWFGFVFLANYLPKHFAPFEAAVWLQIGFAAALVIVQVIIVVWQRSRSSSLAELGWRRPTTPTALVIGFVLGVLYIWGCYFGARSILKGVDVTEITWIRLALAPLGLFMAIAEETMMRGFFMTELQKARVAVWLQIIASGACSGVYHSFQDFSLMGFLPSCVLFTLHAGLYVLGKRSLTPVVVAHGIYNVFGEPYLLMMAMAVMRH
jgi:membrane protease YdiL (CAAX protease family)